MPVLSTGYIIAGACATKARKTMFAQLKDHVRAGAVDQKEVARAVGEFNRFLYVLLVERLKISKGDVVRARIQYDVENGKVKWAYDTFTLEVFQRIPDEKMSDEVKRAVQEAEKIVERPLTYIVEEAITTSYGDKVLYVKLGDEKVGALVATPVNEEFMLIRGAVAEPDPIIFDRLKLSLEGKSTDIALNEKIADLIRTGKVAEVGEVRKIIEGIEMIVKGESRRGEGGTLEDFSSKKAP